MKRKAYAISRDMRIPPEVDDLEGIVLFEGEFEAVYDAVAAVTAVLTMARIDIGLDDDIYLLEGHILPPGSPPDAAAVAANGYAWMEWFESGGGTLEEMVDGTFHYTGDDL